MKKSICIFLLVVSIIILLSGLTMSYFHDKSDKIQVPFTTGTFKIELEEIFPEDLENWEPGEEKAIPLEWSFKNVGSQPAKIRVKIEGEWDDVDELDDGAVDLDIMDIYDSDWEDGVYYVYDGPVDENEEVSIGFYVWLDENSITLENYKAYEGAKYEITLTMEAIQVDGSWE